MSQRDQVVKTFTFPVNDAFVMEVWGKQMDSGKRFRPEFLGDAADELTRAWDVEIDARPLDCNM